ncbi:uncharacterized protein METZ01_LOCUS295020 [marine metagenome]|uniref:Uncharacterized protein n=1 Tax=marine metagenome TaxID=408172 RepID=A0A382LZX7_9ZZZZ
MRYAGFNNAICLFSLNPAARVFFACYTSACRVVRLCEYVLTIENLPYGSYSQPL